MARTPLACLRDSHGFTLIELLVVVLLVGILAAIAIPSFLGQTAKGRDASAKNDVKRLSGMIEECRVEALGNNYTHCNTDAELDGTPGLDWGVAAGQVGVLGASPDIYIGYAISQSRTGNSNHAYYIIKNDDGIAYRVCTPAAAGGCAADNFW